MRRNSSPASYWSGSSPAADTGGHGRAARPAPGGADPQVFKRYAHCGHGGGAGGAGGHHQEQAEHAKKAMRQRVEAMREKGVVFGVAPVFVLSQVLRDGSAAFSPVGFTEVWASVAAKTGCTAIVSGAAAAAAKQRPQQRRLRRRPQFIRRLRQKLQEPPPQLHLHPPLQRSQRPQPPQRQRQQPSQPRRRAQP